MVSSRRKKKLAGSTPPQGLPAVEIGDKVFPSHILAIHRNIAERMGSGCLFCDNCSRVQELSVDQVEQYLKKGLWPVCCEGTPLGGTMRYCRPEERPPLHGASAGGEKKGTS